MPKSILVSELGGSMMPHQSETGKRERGAPRRQTKNLEVLLCEFKAIVLLARDRSPSREPGLAIFILPLNFLHGDLLIALFSIEARES